MYYTLVWNLVKNYVVCDLIVCLQVTIQKNYSNTDDVDLKVPMAGKKSGAPQIVQLPRPNVNDLTSYIKEFEVKQTQR